LLLAYIGQAAYISEDPHAYINPFFNTIPTGMLWPGIIISTLAAVVASQAVITAISQLLSQVMSLSYFPNLKLVHTSERFHGQIYIPVANWLLMIGAIVVTIIYNNVRSTGTFLEYFVLMLLDSQTTSLGNAYGLCVAMVVFITTCMVIVIAIVVWRLHPVIVLPIFLIFITLDGLFLSALLVKVPEGAWFTLMLTAILSIVVFVWRYGKENQWRIESSEKSNFGQLVVQGDDGELFLTEPYGGGEIATLKGSTLPHFCSLLAT
jgi:KUP system potassium uptake protein